MIIEIKGSSIIVPTEVYEFQTYSDDIEVTGEVPSDALVTLEIVDIPWEYMINLKPIGSNKFGTKFILPENVLTFLKKSKEEVFKFKVKINRLSVNGEFPFKINFKSLLANGKSIIENDYKTLLQEYNRLNLKLETYINRNHTDGLHISQIEGLKPGMIPIVMDSAGHIRYDFLFPKYDSILNDVVTLNQKQSDLLVALTERVGNLEKELIDLKYKPIL